MALLITKTHWLPVPDFSLRLAPGRALKALVPAVGEYLRGALSLTLHPRKLHLQQESRGVVFSTDFTMVSAKAAAAILLCATIALAGPKPAFASTQYLSSGTVLSTNLLAGQSAFSITDFYYDLTALPGNSSVTIQFSKDGTNWYSASGTLNGSTSLSTLNGATVSLSALGWSGSVFYYRVTLNATSDLTGTPVWSGVRLDYIRPPGFESMLSVDTDGNVEVGGGGGAGGSALSVLGGAAIGPDYFSHTTTSGLLVEGSVGIGTTSPDTLLTVGSATPSGSVAHFQNSTGSCYINPTTTSLSCSSDSRLKKNVDGIDASSTLAGVLALEPVSYNWNSEATGTPPHTGFIAQAVQAIFPDLVSQGPDGYYTLNYAGFAPYIVSAIQSLADTVNGFAQQFTTQQLTFTRAQGNEVDAQTVSSQEDDTQKLCIGQTCVTESQLQILLRQANQQSAPQTPAPQAQTPTDDSMDSTSSPEASSSQATSSEAVAQSDPATSTPDDSNATSTSTSTPSD